MKKTRIAIFASGTGSNAINIINYFKDSESTEVGFVLSNNKNAPIIDSAKKLGEKVFIHSNIEVSNGSFLTQLCKDNDIEYIILAGYLRLIPSELIEAYNNKIINLHPSLLPNYGGKGMYGANVHKAVLENKETISGITIHIVNEEFDKGRIIAQFTCTIDANDDVFALSKKISYLEQAYLPTVIDKTINHIKR